MTASTDSLPTEPKTTCGPECAEQHTYAPHCQLWFANVAEQWVKPDAAERLNLPTEPTYGDFIVTRRQALVIQAPDITCMAVELLRSIDSAYINGDRIHVGEDEQGEPVTYQITGWDATRVALVLKRIRR